jgi:hypothetical protein
MIIYQQNDIHDVIAKFQRNNNPEDRYASFDYCYRYFLTSSSDELIDDVERSCLVIGFYLASWGMLRGSSFLLNKSIKHYEPLIKYIASLNKNVWQIDIDNYTKENKEIICEIYKKIKENVIENGNSHLTLTTKIMLGVFGFVPAFDNYFGNTFRNIFTDCGFRSINNHSLECIKKFYDYNKIDIDNLADQSFVTDFISGDKTNHQYTKAKIIDMYGFTKGLK